MVRLYCSSYVIAILLSIRGTLSCDPDTGPVGKADCILDATYYSQYQCATCLSDAYIRQKSKGEQHCRNSSATYCYYDCMLEKYGLDSGPVYNDCLCDPNRTLPQPPVILPPACYSPDGTNCNWYRNCLARMFPCTGQVNYAIDYGEKFCKLYEKRLPHFSEQALRWISVVRRCLQVDLVPLLRLCQQHPTCEDIKATAFRSHAPCYLEPYQGFSICYLSVKDWVNIFITIHDSFRTDFIETMKSAVIVVGSCIGKLAEDLGEHIYSVAVYLSGSAPNLSDDEVAHSVILHVSSSLRWDNDSTVHWFAFAVNTSVAEYLLSTASADQQGRNLIIQVNSAFAVAAQQTLYLKLRRFAVH